MAILVLLVPQITYNGGTIRDGALMSIADAAGRGKAAWPCDSDDVVAAFDLISASPIQGRTGATN